MSDFFPDISDSEAQNLTNCKNRTDEMGDIIINIYIYFYIFYYIFLYILYKIFYI